MAGGGFAVHQPFWQLAHPHHVRAASLGTVGFVMFSLVIKQNEGVPSLLSIPCHRLLVEPALQNQLGGGAIDLIFSLATSHASFAL